MRQKGLKSRVECIISEPVEHKTDWRSIYIVALVAFIGSVHTHCISPGIWPYMKLLIPEVSENFYGLLQSVSSVGIVVAALIAGFVSNWLKDTTLPMLFGKCMAILSCCLYMTIELVGLDLKKLVFLIFELMLGISVGAANIYRTHVAMASTEEDRPKAVGICSLAPAVGIFIGPLGQIMFTALGYPGIPFLFGTHINLYTAPILMTIIISLVGSFLLIFCFDGRMRLHKNPETPLKPISEDETSTSSMDSIDSFKYDKLAVFICFYTKMLVNLCTLNFTTIGVPYTMLAFEWTSEKSVLYISVCMVLVGLNICFWNLAYIFLDLRKRLSERRAIIIAIFCLLIAYLLTYPWPFISETIPYQKKINGNWSELGCQIDFTWCATTPRVNMWMFLGSLITVLGFALPLCQINLDILFSKILGNMKQGTLQGMMVVAGECMSIVFPLLLTKVYTISGPIYIWQFEILVISISIILWIVFYSRMIGKSKRVAAKQLK